MARNPKRPRDPNQLGKLIVDLSTGEVEEAAPLQPTKNEAAAALGRKGGAARAKRLTKTERSSIAANAANARWRNSKG